VYTIKTREKEEGRKREEEEGGKREEEEWVKRKEEEGGKREGGLRVTREVAGFQCRFCVCVCGAYVFVLGMCVVCRCLGV